MNTKNRCIILSLLCLSAYSGCQPNYCVPAPAPTRPITPSATQTSPAPLALSTAPPVPGTVTPDNPLTAAVHPTTMPPLIREAAFAYHYWHGQLLAFGGVNPNPGGCNPCSETWVWGWDQNGKGWMQQAPAHSPTARSSTALAYDAERMVIVLFGGADGQQALADTWLWDGEDWTQPEAPGPVNSAVPPSSLVYDGNLHKVVMWQFGEGLWAWEGSAWNKVPFTYPM